MDDAMCLTIAFGLQDRCLDPTHIKERDYEASCAQAVEQLENLASADVFAEHSDPEENDDPDQETGPALADIGCYTNVRHHKDGPLSTVYRARGPKEQAVALKVTYPSAMVPPHDSEREERILRQSSHPHIIPLVDSFHLPGGRFVMVFPFLSTSLEQLLSSGLVSEAQVKSYLYDMFDALEYLHSKGIIHRDVKPSNILLTSRSGQAYLADFGIAWSPTDKGSEPADRKITDVGTTSYRPPELLFGHAGYDSKLDMWAAGCVVAEAVSSLKGPLFDSGPLGSELALIRSIFTTLGTPDDETWPEAVKFPGWGKMSFHKYPPQPWSTILPHSSELGRDLVNKLIRFESSSRLTAAKAKAHEFFSERRRA